MNCYSYEYKTISATVNVSHFKGTSGVDEYHLTVCLSRYGDIETQLQWLLRAYQQALESLRLGVQTVVLRRFFCSDLSNQTAALEVMPFSNPQSPDEPSAISWICQPPIPPAKIALWAYHVKDSSGELDKIQEGTSLTLKRGGLSHHWTAGVVCQDSGSSYDQTRGILEKYSAFLKEKNSSLADSLIRTWFFVQNIDTNYCGMVTARREFFAKHGLSPDTHFVASTGVEGTHANIAGEVTMDAYSISSVSPEQITFLQALDHLSPAYIYGVTFERGTSVAYRDRKHVIISGTASIDHRGDILYPGSLSRQLDRTIENIEVLLHRAGAALDDMCMFIAYVRDPSDLNIVQQQIRERFGDAPIQILLARVCRPGWLVEIEGIAIISESNPQFPEF